MRYDRTIYFVKETPGQRLPNGDYSEATITEVECLASISDMGDETKQLLFGKITQQGLIIRILNDFNEPFDYITVDDLKLVVLRKKAHRRDTAYYCGEYNG